jgi:hypothetical protein
VRVVALGEDGIIAGLKPGRSRAMQLQRIIFHIKIVFDSFFTSLISLFKR